MSDALVIETRNLGKYYGETAVLRDLNLQIRPGSIFALLGRNGAGKTTLLKVLLDMVRPSSGEASVFALRANNAEDSVQIRQRSAFVSEEKGLPDNMTVAEVIRFTAAFYPKWNNETEKRLLLRAGLPRERRVKQLSQGMRTRLAMLLALCRGAELLILDEPTAGLDPAAAEEVLREIISHVANEQITVLFSSHQIAEVEQIADHVAIIERGQLALQGELDAIREAHSRVQLVFPLPVPELVFDAPGIERVIRDDRVVTLVCSANAQQIMQQALDAGAASARLTAMSLKEIFLEKVNDYE